MPLYTFYPRRIDGLSGTFESVDLGSDGEAGDYAARLVHAYQSAVSVAVFSDERYVITYPNGEASVLQDNAGAPSTRSGPQDAAPL